MIFFSEEIATTLLQKSNLGYFMLSEREITMLGRLVTEADFGYKPIGPTSFVEWQDDE